LLAGGDALGEARAADQGQRGLSGTAGRPRRISAEPERAGAGGGTCKKASAGEGAIHGLVSISVNESSNARELTFHMRDRWQYAAA
jgi:hypothetical protein